MVLPAPTRYTEKDFDSLRARLFSLIRSVFPNWTDDVVHNFGNIIVDAEAYVGDVLCYYLNKQAREGRFATVTQRKNLLALCKLIGYSPKNATAATVDVTLTITNAAALTGTVGPTSGVPVVVKTDEVTNPVRGELVGAVAFNLALGETSKTFTWAHQITQPRYQVASSGLADQVVKLPFGPFLYGTQVVQTTGDGGGWTRVDSFLSSGPTDLHYRLQVDQNDLAQVIFGSGQNGKIPEGNILTDYKIGGGLLGMIEPGALKRVETGLVDSAGTPAYCTVSQPLASQGGVPREEVTAARVAAPESLRVLTRAVAREDYEIVARMVPGVGRALMLTSNEDTTVGENRGKLFIVPSTGGAPSTALVNDVYGAFARNGQTSTLPDGRTYPCTVTFQLEVLGAPYRTIDVLATVWLRTGTVPSTVRAAVVAALDDYFSPMLADGSANPLVEFGYNYRDATDAPTGDVPWSDVFNIVRDVAGVRKVGQDMQLNGAVDDVGIANWEMPALGTVTLINGDTGAAL